jgi:hypothetical protein
VHYCVDNDIPYESSVPLESFKDAHDTLDDVKLIKAFRDEKAPLIFAAKTPIPPMPSPALRPGSTRTSAPPTR